MRRRAVILRAAGALAAACTLAACGSSASHTSITGATPSGWTVYHGAGFSVAHPDGWHVVNAGATGHAVVSFFSDDDHQTGSVTARTGAFRQPTSNLLSQVRQSLSATYKSSQITATSVTVAGAGHAELITLRGPGSGGSALIKDLWVSAKDGTQYEVSSGFQDHATGFDPADFVASFKIN